MAGIETDNIRSPRDGGLSFAQRFSRRIEPGALQNLRVNITTTVGSYFASPNNSDMTNAQNPMSMIVTSLGQNAEDLSQNHNLCLIFVNEFNAEIDALIAEISLSLLQLLQMNAIPVVCFHDKIKQGKKFFTAHPLSHVRQTPYAAISRTVQKHFRLPAMNETPSGMLHSISSMKKNLSSFMTGLFQKKGSSSEPMELPLAVLTICAKGKIINSMNLMRQEDLDGLGRFVVANMHDCKPNKKRLQGLLHFFPDTKGLAAFIQQHQSPRISQDSRRMSIRKSVRINIPDHRKSHRLSVAFANCTTANKRKSTLMSGSVLASAAMGADFLIDDSVLSVMEESSAASKATTTIESQPGFSENKASKRASLGIGSSLGQFLQNPHFYRCFKAHCINEFCVENLNFIEEVNEFKGLSSREEKLSKAQYIFENFLDPSSPWQVNTSNRQVNMVRKRLDEEQELNPLLFTPIVNDIMNNTLIDSYYRFIRTQLYQEAIMAMSTNA